MKTIFLYLIMLTIIGSATAQVLVTEPPFASEEDSIVIFFDATEAQNTSLVGYTGDLYTHTGVITNMSDGEWAHVIGNWCDNTAQPQLTRLSTDYYTLTIGNPRDYYDLTNSSEHIQKLAFVFRNPDGSKQTEDLFYTITEGFQVVLLNPDVQVSHGDPRRSPAFYEKGDSVHIQFTWSQVETQVDQLELYSSDVLLESTSEDTLLYSFLISQDIEGFLDFIAVARDTAGLIDSSQFVIFVNAMVEDMPRPGNLQAGIHYMDDSSVTLCLFAPYKDFVYLIGDFNDWQVDPDYSMKRHTMDADSVYWWLTVENLMPGQEYAFQYLVDGNLRIADPYADKILHVGDDPYISEQTYPNLKPYPEDETCFSVSVFQTDQDDFSWQNTNFEKPANEELVIYELLLRDFLAAHDFSTLIDTLDYLQNLGINAIELMPVNEFEGNESWGYNPSFYFALDKYYGQKNDFKTLVDECHRRGIAVIIDLVLNHSYGRSPFVRLYNEGDYGRPTTENPWYNVESPNPVYSWGYDFDHENPATKKLVDRVNRYWIEEYQVDGFRFDFTKGFTNTPGDGGAYDASRISILKRMADAIWQTDSTAYVILEHFADNFEEEELSDYGMLIWGNSNHNYNEASMGWISNSDFGWSYYENRGWTKPGLVSYMESHDEERLMYKNLQYGNSSGSYDITDISIALNRMKLAGAFFFTLPGPKMIWQFGEQGYDFSIDYNGRVGNKPIRWDYLEQGERLKLYKTWAALLKLRNENEVFTNPQGITLDVANTVKRISYTHSSMNVRIVGNFGVTRQDANPNFPYAGMWYDYFSGDTLTVMNSSDLISLEPGEFHIYTDEQLETPEAGILTDVLDSDISLPYKFQLSQNYPNPLNPTTMIDYTVPLLGGARGGYSVNLSVYNALGQKVLTLINRRQKAGKYSVKINGNGLSTGVYFYRLKAGKFIKTKKMILIH